MPENLIFISKRIVLNAICRSENFLWNFEVFVSSQAVSLRCSNEKLFTKHAILLHILLHISRTALHKKHLWETASLFHKFFKYHGKYFIYEILFSLFFIYLYWEWTAEPSTTKTTESRCYSNSIFLHCKRYQQTSRKRKTWGAFEEETDEQ